jgi:hypothetical protein
MAHRYFSVIGFNEDTNGSCSPPKSQYHFDNSLLNALHIQTEVDIVSTGLTVALSITPLACGLAFLAFIVSLFPGRGGRCALITVPFASGIAAFLTTVLFAFDAAKIKTTESLASKATDGDLTINFGTGVSVLPRFPSMKFSALFPNRCG